MSLNLNDDGLEGDKDEKERLHRLTDMVVESVDLVDRAANKKRFLLIKQDKQEASMADQESIEVTESKDGEVIGVQVADPEAGASASEAGEEAKSSESEATKEEEKTDEPTKEGEGSTEVAKEMPKEEEEEEEEDKKKKPEEYPEGSKKECETEEDKKKEEEEEEAAKAETIPEPVREQVLSALREGSERLMSVVSVLRTATTTSEKVAAPLPNKIYGEIEAIKSLLGAIVERYPSPATKAEDESDGTELLKQAGLVVPGPVRDAVVEKLRSDLESLLSVIRETRDMPTTKEKVDAPMPKKLAEAIKGVASSLDEVLQKYPSPSSKSATILGDLQKHFDGIKEIVEGALVGALPAPEKGEAATEKSEPQEDEKGEVTKSLEDLKKRNEELEKEIAALKKEEPEKGKPAKVQDSNAADADGDAKPVEKGDKVVWAPDIAEEIAKKRDKDKN